MNLLAGTAIAQIVLLLALAQHLPAVDMSDPVQVIHAYLRAIYARDYIEAYRFIAADDRKVRDLNHYVRQRGSFNGFTLEVARKLSDSVQIGVVKKTEQSNRAQIAIRYKVPDPKAVAPLVLNWDAFRLNSLLVDERSRILDALEQRRRDGAIAIREGTETFDLVKEGDEWRIFWNWAAGVKIPLRLDVSQAGDLRVELSQNEINVQPGDPFDIGLKIKNLSTRAATVRIGHLVEPADIADYLDFVQCGFLLPVTIQPGKEQEYSGTYLLRGSIPDGVRQLSLSYDFRVLK